MTTLDDDTKLNELRGILSRALKHHTRLSTMFDDPASDVTSWADLELCLRKAVGMTDALSSLPAQAVAWRWRFDDSRQWYYSEGKPDAAPATIVQALCLAPSQPAAVGELLTRAATAARIMMEYDAWEVPAPAPADPIDYAWTAQVINDLAAALVHRDQVKL